MQRLELYDLELEGELLAIAAVLLFGDGSSTVISIPRDFDLGVGGSSQTTPTTRAFGGILAGVVYEYDQSPGVSR